MKILISCSSGISVEGIESVVKEYAYASNITVEVKALPIEMAKNELFNFDVLLLSPQVTFMLDQFKNLSNGRIPVALISVHDFGIMNGKNIYMQAKELVDNK